MSFPHLPADAHMPLRVVARELDALAAVMDLSAEAESALSWSAIQLDDGPNAPSSLAAAHSALTYAARVLAVMGDELATVHRCSRWPLDNPTSPGRLAGDEPTDPKDKQ